MSVHVVIPTMVERAEVLADTLVQLGTVAWVKETGITVSLHSDSRRDAANAIRRGLVDIAELEPRPDWMMYLEDDVWLAPEFALIPSKLSGLDESIGGASFFSLKLRPSGVEVVSGHGFYMAQCLCIRTELLGGFGAYAPDWYRRHPQHYHAADLLLGDYIAAWGRKIAVFYPSLVQHRPERSTFGRRSRARQSPTFAGPGVNVP